MRSSRFKRSLAGLLAVLFAALALPALAQEATQQPAKPGEEPGLTELLSDLLRGSQDAVAAPERRVPFGREDMQMSFAPLVKQTAPAVVNVYASQQVQVRSPFEGDPFFERFFGGGGGGQGRSRVQSSLGSGVLVDASGIVVTNYHVIRDADAVKVAMSDGREFASRVLLKDESLDLAILKISSPQPFPVVPIGDSDRLEVGDLVLAIGNPFGVGQTTTSGIVSALARSHIGVSDFGFFIQTDAAINPGNSGGALINMSGQLIGINTAIYSRSGGSIGIGFAIPSNIVRAVADAARQGRDYFERPYIGATFDLVTPQIAEALGMETPAGALVSAVDANGPAAKAGIKPGDVVLAMNDVPIEHVDALGYRLATRNVGDTAHFTLLSQSEQKTVDIVLERAPEGTAVAQVEVGGNGPFAGTKVQALSPRLAQRLGMRTDTTGVAVVEIVPNSPAAQFGFRPRDVVMEINGEKITSAEKLKQVAESDTRWWRITVNRDGQILRQMLRY